ncbi:MAG: CehA/McbA family metallohydrolase, partial [Candidatus Krumholzibacteriota bacterium]|nr:CehA/McbA family metallohydrolase [Candidatus Krumholzibacteriota bacterium]
MHILDSVSGDTLAARCGITDCNLVPRYPPRNESFYQSVEEGYFYSSGSFSVVVPEGMVILRLRRGFEYETLIDTFAVLNDTTVTRYLTRWYDMRAEGWYCGDCHLHIYHGGVGYIVNPSDAHLMGRAEGLDVLNCLDNAFYFSGAPDPCSTDECIVYMSGEIRSGYLGHAAVLGLSRPLGSYNYNWHPLFLELADSVHLRPGALFIAAHPVSSEDFTQTEDWPGSGIARELPVDVARGKVDAFEVLSYSNCHQGGIELEMWYNFLNCGFKLPGCGGTDAVMNRFSTYPLGGYRTYVDLTGTEFSYSSWLEGLKQGRTFFTNGPIFTSFKVLIFEPGEVADLYLEKEYKFPVEITVRCAYPLQRAEIVINGEVASTLYPSADPCLIDTALVISYDRSFWIAARAYGPSGPWIPVGDHLFAHTGPVYFDMAGKTARDMDAAGYFVDWIDDLIDLSLTQGHWDNPQDSVRAIWEFRQARDFYLALASEPTGEKDIEPLPAVPPACLEQNTPNPFSSGTHIEFRYSPAGSAGILNAAAEGGGGAPAELTVYDVKGRRVRTLFRGYVPSGRHRFFWDG